VKVLFGVGKKHKPGQRKYSDFHEGRSKVGETRIVHDFLLG
jgi:hypothetical protein